MVSLWTFILFFSLSRVRK